MGYKILMVCVALTVLFGFLSFCLWWAKPSSFRSNISADVDVKKQRLRSTTIDDIERKLARVLVRLFLSCLSISILAYIGVSINV
jgi:hypothetical protein